MGADSLAENTPNAPEFICPICLPKPKSSGFQWRKASLGVRSPCSYKQSVFLWYKHRPQTSSVTSYCIILSFSFLYVICKKFQCLLILQFTTLRQHKDSIYFTRQGLDYQKVGVVGLWTKIAESINFLTIFHQLFDS